MATFVYKEKTIKSIVSRRKGTATERWLRKATGPKVVRNNQGSQLPKREFDLNDRFQKARAAG